MLKVGLSIANEVFEEQNLADMKSSGIDAVEISHGNYRKYENFDYKKACYFANKHNIKIWSLHLPFLPFEELDPTAFDTDKRKFTFDTFLKIIKNGAEIGIDKFVVHPSAEPNKDEDRTEKLEIAADFFNELAEKAHTVGAVLAIENLPRTCIGNCSAEINYILNANEKLKSCYDTNHLLGENCIDFIKNVSPKILTLHISDYDFLNERHWLPGEGDNDWKAIYNALTEVNYNGMWLYELGLSAPSTINRRELIYKDFYNNAREIMSGKNPTPIGKRVEGLTSWK